MSQINVLVMRILRKKLDEKGRCQNQSCPDYIRTQIIENSAKEKNNSPEN